MSGIRTDFCGIRGNDGTLDANGVKWTFNPSDGWDSAEQSVEVGHATSRLHSFLMVDDVNERRPVLDVMAQASTKAGADAAYRLIKGNLPPRGTTGELIVYEPVPLKAICGRAYRPRAWYESRYIVHGQLELLALQSFLTVIDPTEVNFAASSTHDIVNNGDEVATVTVLTTGAGTVILQDNVTGRVMRTRTSVPSGTTFDGSTFTVTSGGVEIFPMGSPSEWLSAPPGTTSFSNLGTAPVRVSIYDTFS